MAIDKEAIKEHIRGILVALAYTEELLFSSDKNLPGSSPVQA